MFNSRWFCLLPNPTLEVAQEARWEGFTTTRGAAFNKSLDINDGTISTILPLHTSSLTFLIGGGRSPLYPPNKVVLWDEAKSRTVAELEFRERVRGISCRRNWLAVALRHRVAAFQFNENKITKYGEWDTCDNPRGLISTL
jgi:WD repeat-containing protein 45